MKYTCTVDVELPIAKVAELWADKNYFSKWQDGFERITLLSGEEGAIGAQSKIVFNGKPRMELIETIMVNNLPVEKKALYEHIHMTNTQTTRFLSLETNKTRFISEVEYTQFNGVFIKLIAKLFPGKFKAQSQKWMDQFKIFAEQYEIER